MRRIKVAIVEDRSDLRKSLVVLMNECRELECIYAATTGEEALEKIPQLKPDIVLMDLHLPRMSGIECTRQLRAINPKLEILMLTVEEHDDDLVFRALRAGASGYLVKRHSMDKILTSIKAVHRGEVPISANIARKILAAFHQDDASTAGLESLTEREEQILSMIAEGRGRTKEIASALSIEPGTVDTHLRSAYRKLAVQSRAQAAVKFLGWSGAVRRLKIPQRGNRPKA